MSLVFFLILARIPFESCSVLCRGFESAEILDYKSDNTLITSELIERHRAQLELCRKSLHRMTGIKISDIKLKIAALRSGKIVEIE